MAGGTAASFGSGSSSSSRGGLNQRVKCNCGRDAIVRTVRNGPNVGMRFHGCPLWPERGCVFFKWVAGSNEIDDLRYQVLEKDTTLAEKEFEKKLMEEKIKKLQVKRENLEEEIQDMKLEISQIRIELMKSSRNEKNFSMSLFFSWVFFACLLFYLK
uniref:GRF-type domain-containing protein n=1 Tax=Chenopodium quinoa TaxID=63459 RepID=A0A803N2G8_CHEQI